MKRCAHQAPFFETKNANLARYIHSGLARLHPHQQVKMSQEEDNYILNGSFGSWTIYQMLVAARDALIWSFENRAENKT